MSRFATFRLSLLLVPFVAASTAYAQTEWTKILEAARKEGKVVVGTPPTPEFRKAVETLFKPKYGIEPELLPGRGPAIVSRIEAEAKGGIPYFDLFLSGTASALPLVQSSLLDPVEPYLVLPEVKDPKNWWGGHIWDDNVSSNRFLYSFIATARTSGLWYNTELVKPDEVRSFDDLLHPKWKGRIGFVDPRNPGPGQSIWSFLWGVKGEEYLKKLAQQDLLLTQNYRQITEGLAKGRLALAIGAPHHQYEPFVKAGLPIKELPEPKEGLPASSGFGVLGIVKNPPHPNATRVFVNWLLGREGQEAFSRAMLQATRRVDVDTRWMTQVGVTAAKDVLTVEEYHKVRNHLEDKVLRIWIPAGKLADQLLK